MTATWVEPLLEDRERNVANKVDAKSAEHQFSHWIQNASSVYRDRTTIRAHFVACRLLQLALGFRFTTSAMTPPKHRFQLIVPVVHYLAHKIEREARLSAINHPFQNDPNTI